LARLVTPPVNPAASPLVSIASESQTMHASDQAKHTSPRQRGRHLRNSPRRSATIVAILVLCALIALGWRQLGPVGFGGDASYAMVQGTSMLPTIHGGDLVVTRRQASYHVGEIVAYHNRILHETVIHRIVGRQGNRYVMKGDNNSFTDTYEPVSSDIVGARWTVVPGGARLLTVLHEPFVAGAVGALIGFMALAGDDLPGRARHRRRRRLRGSPAGGV